MAKIDIILPVYNAERYLDRCLKSIERQTMQDFSVLAINDNSTDHSLDILQKWERKWLGKMMIIDKFENEGAAKARKTGVEISNAPYLCFIDSDDYINRHYLENLVTTLEDKDANMAISRFAMHFNYPILQRIGIHDKKRTPLNFSLTACKEKLPTINVVTTAKLYKREYFNITDKNFKANEDLAINYLNFALADRITYTKDAFYHYCPNQEGLVAKELSGYSYQNIWNTLSPLEELKNRFKEHHMFEYYYQELECLYLKNLFQRFSTILKSREPKEKQNDLISCLLSYMEMDFPNWRENPYYRENFKTLEIPDTINCLLIKSELEKMTLYQIGDTKSALMNQYQKVLKGKKERK